MAPINIQALQVAFRYPQNRHGLNPISLEIRPGEISFIKGSSGCGKSTLARCLTGLIPHLYRGEMLGKVWIDGLLTQSTPLWQLSEHAGLVFQNPASQMITQSVEEEVLFGLENMGLQRPAIEQRLDDALNRFGLERFRHDSPYTLSGGEQQKLALAAITARQPVVLVLDEPLSMLDGTAAMDLIQHLNDLAKNGTSIVICEHRSEYLASLTNLHTVDLNHNNQRREEGQAIPAIELAIPSRPGARLDIHNLQVTLSERKILNNINLSAKGGQVIAIVGRNGTGKTTLLRAIAGLQSYQGTITTEENSDQNDKESSPPFGLVFQNPDLQLFNASVHDEILFRITDPDMDYYSILLRTLGLDRYETVPPLLLSEGEKKRLALAIALMRRPKYGILLDEPALGQDEYHKAILIRLARNLADAGMLVIFTTHDLALAMLADRLLLLTPNGFITDGVPSDVIKEQAVWNQVGLIIPPWIQHNREVEQPVLVNGSADG